MATSDFVDRRSWRWFGAALFGVVLALAACGGGSDPAATTTLATFAPAAATTPVTPAATAPAALVKTGAKVVVANASRVNGAAGRMSKQLQEDGFTMGTPTNAGGNFQKIETTKIFYVAGDAAAQAVANTLKTVLGVGQIEVLEMPTPAPTETGELEAGNTVLVVLGNDTADKTLATLQGATAPATQTTPAPAAGGTTVTTSTTVAPAGSTPAAGSTATS